MYGSNDFAGADDAVYRWEGVVWLSVATGLLLNALFLLVCTRRAQRWLGVCAACAAALGAESVQAARLAYLADVGGSGSVALHFHGLLNGLWALGGLAGLTAAVHGAARWRASGVGRARRRLPE